MNKTLSLLFAALILLPTSVSAQEEDTSFRLITSPLPINLSADPGTEVKAAIKVKNDGTKKETIKISVFKFNAYEDTGKPRLLDPEEGDDFLKWVTFSEDPFTVEPQEWKTITATWTVPDTAALSYYYALLFSRADQNTQAKERQTSIQGGSAVLALLEARVPGAKKQVSVPEFSTDRKWYEFLPASFTVRLKNEGNVHVAPRGNIFISKGGENIATLEVNPTKGNILPDTTRVFEESWSDGFPVYKEKLENGKAVLDEQGNHIYELSWDWKDLSKIRFGTYEAKLFLIYDDGTKDVPIEGSLSFFMMPWRMVLAALAVALLAAVGLKNTVQNSWRKAKKLFSRGS